ncbi:porin family protein [Flavitalea sp. BT771]|uniref:porin family protein n=1 Tax=Flavitalea sp. BT771 TaxID=3063329 RepID=UPI0026E28C10|nr:porin family protein [Flavitalea sp. BT771]MDO6433147.1 porin family protein [Flavitalea sp. BT771]MDV6221577.1 porin family protein [Flavitalea sp. BT771]
MNNTWAIYIVLTLLQTPASIITAKGQLSMGLDLGYDHNRLHTDVSNRSYTSNHPKAGFFAGIPLQYFFSSRIALLAEPSFAQKNSLIKRTGPFTGIYASTINNYWQLPVMIRFTFAHAAAFGFYVDLGLYTAYWSGGRTNGATPAILNIYDSVRANGEIDEYFRLVQYDTKKQFDTRRDQRFESGWVSGAGISYQMSRHYSLFVQARYTQSLTDQQKKYMANQAPRYNETYYITMGILFRL